ncbi:unnamed protein product [Lactuca virosa]|uniref:Uncharacterized protein n=1 Tax=Lactuca virosa TaxID=75947 RepID=A0AAU9P9A1_9ASTR|nr:unnamed protein product [Lactuca virosa]
MYKDYRFLPLAHYMFWCLTGVKCKRNHKRDWEEAITRTNSGLSNFLDDKDKDHRKTMRLSFLRSIREYLVRNKELIL